MKVENENIYVLHTYPFKETSLIVDVFSENYGRVSLLAKGARRPRSILRGYLQPFQKVQAEWSGKNELKTLFSVEWVDKFLGLEGDGLVCGFYLNEILIHLLPKEDENKPLFILYDEALKQLSNAKDAKDEILRNFELSLLQALGYQLTLDTDEHGSPIDINKNYRYEAEYGASDLEVTQNGIEISGKTLRDMSVGDFTDKITSKQSKQLMRYLIAFYLGNKKLKSKELFLNIK
ncbi:MAG: DNA repair protein RecO [Nitrosomonadales bacterium]|jgi:DNA repair protein RecO (recombination protein O)